MSFPALLLAIAAPTEAVSAELLPAGKWQAEYAKSSCIISRAFGEKPNLTMFGLKPAPNSDFVTLLIIQPSSKGRSVSGEAEVRLSSGFVPEYADYWSVTANGVRVTTIGVPRATLDALAKGDSIAVKAGALVDVALRPTAFDKALLALKECEADLLASWGYSRAAQAAVAKQAEGTLRGLIRSDDYPGSLIDRDIQGTVGFRIRIEPDGSISDCAIIESSGAPDLDKHTCNLAKKRARYLPATGHDGKPLWSFTFGRVTWRIGS